MEFKTLAVMVLAVVVLIVLIMMAINVSGILGQQVNNASSMLRL